MYRRNYVLANVTKSFLYNLRRIVLSIDYPVRSVNRVISTSFVDEKIGARELTDSYL